MPAFGIFALFALAAIGGTLLLWAAIERETDGNPRMSRADAERTVRQDTNEARRDVDERDTTDDTTDWGTDTEWGVEEDR
ncbi:hypothetical protein JCM30237_22300 [Halolamina litorea]|uniref:Cytochrome oxidase maturation protein, cbb3-type n=1 Tax=Halolamina litorea TaxID=1515593 RepID=A0ABD6BRC4_9EURY|nr:hypothetical protein [Halolamina litorea]